MISLLSSIVLLSLAAEAPRGEPTREQIDFFEKKIRPVLVAHCYKCHSAQSEKVRGRLLLDTRDGMRKGGDSGPAIVPGDPVASLLLNAIRYEDRQMPPAGKLPEHIIADFHTWIKQGAADPRAGNSLTLVPKPIDIQAGKRFWSFQPPRACAAPSIQSSARPQKKIDSFILACLEQAGFEPSLA